MRKTLEDQCKAAIRLAVHETSPVDIAWLEEALSPYMSADDHSRMFSALRSTDAVVRQNHSCMMKLKGRNFDTAVAVFGQVSDAYTQMLLLQDGLDKRWGCKELKKYLPKK